MSEIVQENLNQTKELMTKAFRHAEVEMSKIKAGKASPDMLDGIKVSYYGSDVPLNQVCTVNTLDARTIVVQPYEKPMMEPIEKAIRESNLGFNPQNDGSVIRINVPQLTEERRLMLVKTAKNEAEKGRISIRNIRKDMNDKAKKSKDDGVSDDLIKDCENEIQKLTNTYIAKIDELVKEKEKVIMTV